MTNKQFSEIQAIVYVSETGHTKQYAELLAEKISLPVYELTAAKKKMPKTAATPLKRSKPSATG